MLFALIGLPLIATAGAIVLVLSPFGSVQFLVAAIAPLVN